MVVEQILECVLTSCAMKNSPHNNSRVAADSVHSLMHGMKTGGNVVYADVSADTAN